MTRTSKDWADKIEWSEYWSLIGATVFNLAPTAAGTDVTWTMSGPQPYVSKLMATFMSMDKMIGGDFEKGLAQLKTVSEK